MQVTTLKGFGMEKCNKDCLHCILPKCIHDVEDESKLFRDELRDKPKKKVAKPKKKNRELVVSRKRGRPKKEREIPYWDEYYAKNGEKIRARNKARYYAKRDEILEKCRIWRENHRDYHKEYYRKKKEKEHEHNGESESLVRQS